VSSLTAVRPGTDGNELKRRVEAEFGIKFEWRETSYLADLYLLGPPYRKPHVFRRLLNRIRPSTPLPFTRLKIYRNEEGFDAFPVIEEFPMDHWVFEFSEVLDELRLDQFLASEGAIMVETT
jgi:hypothetical protein